jgi:4-hydroxy-tetrahydrodipicolinate synthase
MHAMVFAGLAGDVKEAREINAQLLGLHRHLFCEANPIPVKWACARMGLIKNALRLPLTPLASEFHDRVLGAMRDAGVNV